MRSQGVQVMGLQETRLSFEGDEPIVRRKLFINGVLLHIYLMSAVKGYNGRALLSTQPLTVQKVNDRIMKGTFILGSMRACIFNVYSSTANAKRTTQDDFDEALFNAWFEIDTSVKFICGDLNAPLLTNRGRKCFTKRAKRLRKLLLLLGAKSAHEGCCARRKWTYRFPKTPKHPDGLTKQLDHIIVNKRLFSSLRSQNILIAPTPTRHCSLSAQFDFRWKNLQKSQQQPFWGSPPKRIHTHNICY